jgi:hypothetical protein
MEPMSINEMQSAIAGLRAENTSLTKQANSLEKKAGLLSGNESTKAQNSADVIWETISNNELEISDLEALIELRKGTLETLASQGLTEEAVYEAEKIKAEAESVNILKNGAIEAETKQKTSNLMLIGGVVLIAGIAFIIYKKFIQ